MIYEISKMDTTPPSPSSANFVQIQGVKVTLTRKTFVDPKPERGKVSVSTRLQHKTPRIKLIC
jgi:hypothetical protein